MSLLVALAIVSPAILAFAFALIEYHRICQRDDIKRRRT